MKTVALLAVSNIFMTFARYGHLKYRHTALWKVIVASWLIAFLEYCFRAHFPGRSLRQTKKAGSKPAFFFTFARFLTA